MRIFAPIVLAALVAAPALGASDSTLVRSYEVGAVNLQLSIADPTGVILADCLTSDCSLDVGGFAFALPAGSSVVDIALADQASERVRGLACQSTNGNNICGEPGEPGVQFCDSLAQPITNNGVAFVGGVPLTVFVFASPLRVSVGNPGSSGAVLCPDGSPNFATQGTVTVTLSP